MLNSLGLIFFWHMRNGGGGWSEATFCFWCGGVALCNRNGVQRNEDCNVLQCDGGAKSVTEKNNRRAGVGSAASLIL